MTSPYQGKRNSFNAYSSPSLQHRTSSLENSPLNGHKPTKTSFESSKTHQRYHSMSTQRDTFVFPDKQALLSETLESNNTGFSESPDDDHASAGYITPTERDHQIATRNNILSPTGIDRKIEHIAVSLSLLSPTLSAWPLCGHTALSSVL